MRKEKTIGYFTQMPVNKIGINILSLFHETFGFTYSRFICAKLSGTSDIISQLKNEDNKNSAIIHFSVVSIGWLNITLNMEILYFMAFLSLLRIRSMLQMKGEK